MIVHFPSPKKKNSKWTKIVITSHSKLVKTKLPILKI